MFTFVFPQVPLSLLTSVNTTVTISLTLAAAVALVSVIISYSDKLKLLITHECPQTNVVSVMDKKKKFTFKKKPEPRSFRPPARPQVVEIDSDLEDFDVEEILTNDSATNTDTDTDNNNSGSSSGGGYRSDKNKEAWSEIMAKMKQPKLTEQKREEAQAAWKGLMNTMQKNQQGGKSSATKNTFKRVRGNSKKPVTTNQSTVKRLRTEEIITVVDELELVEVYNGKEEKSSDKKPNVPVHPIFMGGGLKVGKKENEENHLEEVKPWDLLHTDNPWACDGEDDPPEVVLLNERSDVTEPSTNPKTKVCPFYKKMPGTKFSVDAFNFGVIPGIDVYLLSHFHSDHYIGLTKKFSKTLICSVPTGNLVRMKLGVAENCIRKLKLNKIYVIQGVEIVLVDANHCPGSVMFILRLPNGITYLHTGDFRFTPEMLTNKYLQKLRVDSLYLDTTYCDPRYNFPMQFDSISVAIVEIKKHLAYRPRTLIVCGTYCIGKERVFCAVADSVGSKVFCEYEKRRVIKALENQYFMDLLCDNEASCQVHVLSMQKINAKSLSEYLASRSGTYSNILAVKPSGWEFSKGPKSGHTGSNLKSFYNDTVTILGVPYSEHSSFSELERFVAAVNPVKVQPTVNVGSATKRADMTEHIDKWLS